MSLPGGSLFASRSGSLFESTEALIDSRHLWKGDSTRLLGGEPGDNITYDERGQIYCTCPVTGETRSMANWGFEKNREALKFRCPAVANDFPCRGRDQCPGGDGSYGRTVRVPLEKDRRIFTPTVRDSATWKRGYDSRTAVERVNDRIDNVLGFENHTIRGLAKMRTRVGLALIVMLAMALGRILIGQKDEMRSMVKPVVPGEQPAIAV